MYQRKYWLVQTLLKVTNAKVCANIVFGRSFFASTKGVNTALRSSCGRNARRSNPKDCVAGPTLAGFGEDFR